MTEVNGIPQISILGRGNKSSQRMANGDSRKALYSSDSDMESMWFDREDHACDQQTWLRETLSHSVSSKNMKELLFKGYSHDYVRTRMYCRSKNWIWKNTGLFVTTF